MISRLTFLLTFLVAQSAFAGIPSYEKLVAFDPASGRSLVSVWEDDLFELLRQDHAASPTGAPTLLHLRDARGVIIGQVQCEATPSPVLLVGKQRMKTKGCALDGVIAALSLQRWTPPADEPGVRWRARLIGHKQGRLCPSHVWSIEQNLALPGAKSPVWVERRQARFYGRLEVTAVRSSADGRRASVALLNPIDEAACQIPHRLERLLTFDATPSPAQD